jgi:hypothetical protein
VSECAFVVGFRVSTTGSVSFKYPLEPFDALRKLGPCDAISGPLSYLCRCNEIGRNRDEAWVCAHLGAGFTKSSSAVTRKRFGACLFPD